MGPKHDKPSDAGKLSFSWDPEWPELTSEGTDEPGTTPGLVDGPIPNAKLPRMDAGGSRSDDAVVDARSDELARPTIPAPPSPELREQAKRERPPESGPRATTGVAWSEAREASTVSPPPEAPRRELPTLRDFERAREAQPTLHDLDPVRHDLPGLDQEWDDADEEPDGESSEKPGDQGST